MTIKNQMAKEVREELENLSQRLWTRAEEAKRKYAEANWKLLEGLGKLSDQQASKIFWDKEIFWTEHEQNLNAYQELDKILTKGDTTNEH